MLLPPQAGEGGSVWEGKAVLGAQVPGRDVGASASQGSASHVFSRQAPVVLRDAEIFHEAQVLGAARACEQRMEVLASCLALPP